ncbi:hypothetical protein LP420_27025 [Massilia sp. B-10]|nr:hypothetical protein LP420_27025 [Massilia sp. B-10]
MAGIWRDGGHAGGWRAGKQPGHARHGRRPAVRRLRQQCLSALTAQGKLSKALSQQLASAAPIDKDVRVGLSFVSRQGEYCRSFMLLSHGRTGLPQRRSVAHSHDGQQRRGQGRSEYRQA